MRPPLRLIEPATRGVSMRDARRRLERGLAGHASGPAPAPGTGAAWPGAGWVPVGAGCPVGAGAPGCGTGVVGCCCVCCCLLLLLLLHRSAGRKRSAIRSARWPTARWRAACSSGRSSHRPVLRPPPGVARWRSMRPQRVAEVFDHVVELPAQGGAPSNQHVVVARAQTVRRRALDDVAQPPAHAIALDRGPDLARHREPDAGRPARPRGCAPAARTPPSQPWPRWLRPGNPPAASTGPL